MWRHVCRLRTIQSHPTSWDSCLESVPTPFRWDGSTGSPSSFLDVVVDTKGGPLTLSRSWPLCETTERPHTPRTLKDLSTSTGSFLTYACHTTWPDLPRRFTKNRSQPSEDLVLHSVTPRRSRRVSTTDHDYSGRGPHVGSRFRFSWVA